MKLSKLLAETSMVQDQPWPDGIAFEDDPAAAEPELGSKPPNPTEYYAATTALGPHTTRGAYPGGSLRRNFAQSADDWLLDRYLHSRWHKIHKGPDQ